MLKTDRDRIVETAADLFHRMGAQSVPLEQILERARVSPESYASCFTCRQELVALVAEYQMNRIMNHLQPYLENMSSWEDVRRWEQGVVKLLAITGQLGCPVGVLAMDGTPEARLAYEAVQRALDRWARAHVKGLASLQRHGVLNEQFNPKAAARFAGAILQGSLLLCRAFQDSDILQTSMEQFIHYLSQFRVRQAAA